MRWVFLILIAVNAAFFYWNVQAQKQRANARPPVTASAAVTQLVLITELQASDLRERRQQQAADEQPDSGTSAAPAVASAAPVIALRCYSVGPLPETDESEGISQWLTERGAHLELREDERRELSRYWVHFPPFAGSDEAEQRVMEMRAKGIEDIHVIRRGNMANAVSLGVYSRKPHLDRRIVKLKKLGYDAAVHERYKTHRASWYDVVLPADTPLDDAALAERFPQIESRERSCGGKPAT